MKNPLLVLTLLSAASLPAAVHAQAAKNQAGGLPALAAEVAELRAMIEDLQDQVGANGDPYTGTYAVTILETGLFGCRPANPPSPPPVYVQPFFGPLLSSSVTARSASFEAEADGSTLRVPEFVMMEQELRLSGYYAPSTDAEEEVNLVIGGDGSFTYNFGDSQLEGQFADDGSMFSALVVGRSLDTPAGGCEDVWTAHVTGVRK